MISLFSYSRNNVIGIAGAGGIGGNGGNGNVGSLGTVGNGGNGGNGGSGGVAGDGGIAYAGGFVGWNNTARTIRDAYSTGTLTLTGGAGGAG